MAAKAAAMQIKRNKRQAQENRAGYAFVLPYVIAYTIFTGIPFIIALSLSFLNVKYITKLDNLKFVGLDNFVKFFQSPEGVMALLRTFEYSLIYVPVIMVLGFLLAVLLNRGVHFKKSIRAMTFLPYVSNMVAVAVIFKLLLGQNGPIYEIMKLFGMTDPPLLLLDPIWALPTVVLISVWKGVGLNMITYLAALQDVPTELLEAAQIDGANKWKQVLHVILPQVSPTTFFLLISSILTSLQNFTVIQALTGGGPGQATTVMSVNIVRTAFTSHQTSYASAQAMIVFAIVMVITIIQWRGQKKWANN